MKYKVSLTTKIKPASIKTGSGINAIEPDDYTVAQVKAIKAKGYIVLSYLSVGTIEKERSWWKAYSKYKLRQLPDWPKEYYIDLRKTEWRSFLKTRAKALREKGFDGWWLDNLDIYSEYKSGSMFTAVAAVLQSVKKIGGYVMINGGSEWLDDAIDRGIRLKDYLDGYTQEEVFSLIKDYSGKGKFGTQKKEDSKFYKALIQKLIKRKIDCFCLEYTRDDALKKTIADWCSKNGAGYYISGDVNL